MAEKDLYDIIIVGGGPVGLFAAFYAGLRHMRTKVIEALHMLGGQPTALYPEKYIYDVGGHRKILAKELVKSLIDQAMMFSPTVCLNEKVIGLKRKEDGIITVLTEKSKHEAKTVVLAMGLGEISYRRLKVKDIEKYEGRSVHYSLTNLERFSGKKVVVVGGGDTAVDWVTELLDKTPSRNITLVHRSDKFRAHEEPIEEIRKAGVKILTFHEVDSLEGDDVGKLKAVWVKNNQSGERVKIKSDHLAIAIGYQSHLGSVPEWGVKMATPRTIQVDVHRETSMKGVFAAGDICWYEGRINLLAIGFADAAIAVNYAKALLEPGTTVNPGHSTSLIKE